MGRWRKLLAATVADRNPRSYTYEDAVRVLTHLGFEQARAKPGGTHRLWRREIADAAGKRTVFVGLVEKGHGTLKPVYVEKMIDILRTNGLLPDEV